MLKTVLLAWCHMWDALSRTKPKWGRKLIQISLHKARPSHLKYYYRNTLWSWIEHLPPSLHFHMSSSAAWLIEHHKSLKLRQENCGCSSLNSTCSKICVNFRVETLACFGHTRWRLWNQLGEEGVLIRFLWQQSHNGFQKRKGLHALLLLFQSVSLLANFLRQASAAHQGHLDLRRPAIYIYMSPLRRYSNIYVSFEEIQQYIYICLLWGDQMKYYFEKP